ncbi:MAG: hypothetical protein JW829_17270 [Pirellulales bacterium]|nr:hypothetical protein [Pirellulales bacterium]
MQHPAHGGNLVGGRILLLIGAVLLAASCLAVPIASGQLINPIGIGTVDSGEEVFSPVTTWEWNTDGDFEGWATAYINYATVSGGTMSGESLGDGSSPAAADPMINSPGGLGIIIGNDPGEVSRIQFSLQMDIGAPTSRTEIFLFFTNGVIGEQPWTPTEFPVMTDGLFHTYTLDFDSTSPIWGLTINSLRVDPVADNPNVADTFAYDFLRLGSFVDPGKLDGDVDEDGDVDSDDFELIRANFFGMNVGRSKGDLNLDGIVDLFDFGEWKDNFPFPADGYLARLVGAIPEPGCCILLGIAFVLLAIGRAFRRR